jgi:hypothetical protein
MAASSKKPSKPVVVRPSAPKTLKANKPALAEKSEPFVRVYFSQALHKNALAVLATLEASPDPIKHRDALADLVVELTNAGMDYCFIAQLKLANPGFITQQSANLGMAGALQVLGSVLRNVICRMDKAQLLSVCGSIRLLMR